jgi:hypothetical protein
VFELNVVPLEKRHARCKCVEPCGFVVQFKDMSGDVEHTMCANGAKNFAMGIIDKLVQANNDVLRVRKDRNRDKRWTPEEVHLLIKHRERGLSYGQIAIKMGRTLKSVKHKLHREGQV